jgi:hypothetical protein
MPRVGRNSTRKSRAELSSVERKQLQMPYRSPSHGAPCLLSVLPAYSRNIMPYSRSMCGSIPRYG